MKRSNFRAIFCGAALCAFAIFSSLARSEEPNRGVNVDVNAAGVHVDTNRANAGADANRKTSGDAVSSAVIRGKDIMNLKVYGENDENLGKIEDLVIDPAEGKIRYAVLSFGGFLGMGDKLFTIPWNDLKMVPKGLTSSGTQKEDYCVLDVKKDDLKNAPGFDKNHWPNFADRSWSINIDKYYNDHRRASKPGATMR